MISMRGPSPLPSALSGVGSMMICAISSGLGNRPSSKPSMIKPDTSSARSPLESAPASSSRYIAKSSSSVGSASSSSPDSIVAVKLVSGSTRNWSAALTSTTSSRKSRTNVTASGAMPGSARIVWSTVWKAGADTWSRYSPTGTSKAKVPAPSVVVSRTGSAASPSNMRTAAACITPPVSSVTVPATRAVC